MACSDWNKIQKNAETSDWMDILPGGIAGIHLADKKVFFCSSNLLAITGYTQADWDTYSVNERYTRLFGAQQAEIVASQAIEQLSQTGRASLRCSLQCGDGAQLPVRMLAGISKDEEGSAYTLCVFLDDRETQKAQAKMERAQKEMDTLTNTIPGGVARLCCDEDFHILFASDGYYEMVGYTREECHEEPICDRGRYFIFPEDIAAVSAAVERLIREKESVYVEYRVRKKDGSTAWNTAYCAGVEFENGQIYINAVFIDNTAAKNTADRLVSLTNSIPGGVAHIRVRDNALIVDYASDGFYRLSGYTKEEYQIGSLASNYLDLIHPDDRKQVLTKARRFVGTDRVCPTLDYRIIRKDGTVRWVRARAAKIQSESDGKDSLECILSDITESKQTEQQLELNEERYRIVMDETQDIIFDWDLVTDYVYHSPVFERKFGYTIPSDSALDFVQRSDYVHDADRPQFNNMIDRLRQGDPSVEVEYRIKKSCGSYVWCRVRATAIYDENHRPARAVGIITDIDGYKKEAAFLREKAQIDLLTGLLNKITTQEQITYLLKQENSQKHALYVIDIDNFKQINDSLGHSLGDAILTEISARIRQQFRKNDIIGRIGGDEFMVFLSDIDAEDTVRCNAEKLATIFHHTFFSHDKSYKISGSIGVAVFPQDGASFPELYQKADQALYLSKRKGKDCFSFCGESENTLSASLPTPAKTHKIDSDAYSSRDLIQLVFEILYDAKNLDSGIQIVLNLIAHQYQIDQIYLYSYTPEHLFAKTAAYSSVSDPVLLPDSVAFEPADLNRYLSRCDENGVFFCPDIQASPETLFRELHMERGCSIHTLALEGKVCKGLVGLHTRITGKEWPHGQSESCVLLSKILANFLIRKNHISENQ